MTRTDRRPVPCPQCLDRFHTNHELVAHSMNHPLPHDPDLMPRWRS